MSCDWDKHCSIESILKKIGKEYKSNNKKEFKNPNEYFFCKLNVGAILSLSCNDFKHEITHDSIQYYPTLAGIPNNRAHSLVKTDNWEDKTRVAVRNNLMLLSRWVGNLDFDNILKQQQEFTQKISQRKTQK